MLKAINRLESLVDKIENYGKTSFELYKLKTINKTAGVLSTFVSRGIFVIVISMFLIFASVALALWLGELLGESYFGFLCVAAFYLILGVIFYFILHKSIKRIINNLIVVEVFKD